MPAGSDRIKPPLVRRAGLVSLAGAWFDENLQIIGRPC
jgi:hypothetical protein